MTHRHCWTVLLHAVWSNNVELVQELCRQGARTLGSTLVVSFVSQIREADNSGLYHLQFSLAEFE